MFHTFRVPGPPLSRYISELWIASSPGLPFCRERLLPDGRATLVIPLTDNPATLYEGPYGARKAHFTGPFICGVHTRDITIDTVTQKHVMGASFLPGGSQPFLGGSSRVLHNETLNLAEFWGDRSLTLHEQLLAATDDAQRFRLLESALLQQLILSPHPAVTEAVARLSLNPAQRISPLANELGLGQRRFQQIFTDTVGVPPKVFARLQRFTNLLYRTTNLQEADWSLLALDNGYYDQAHLIREFRAMSGMTPETYLRSERRMIHHMPILPPAECVLAAPAMPKQNPVCGDILPAAATSGSRAA
ncbi:MAG: helix-turn-helix domain-containing protein [Alcanivorax sp.]|nr:helix-turn-helix domain-containing protein [Alcanivorax sp.]